MSPLEIEILLWYHTRAADFRDGDFTAPAVRQAIDSFRDEMGLLMAHRPPPGDDRSYILTPKAEAFVRAILMMPLPICVWTVPGAPISIPVNHNWIDGALNKPTAGREGT